MSHEWKRTFVLVTLLIIGIVYVAYMSNKSTGVL